MDCRECCCCHAVAHWQLCSAKSGCSETEHISYCLLTLPVNFARVKQLQQARTTSLTHLPCVRRHMPQTNTCHAFEVSDVGCGAMAQGLLILATQQQCNTDKHIIPEPSASVMVQASDPGLHQQLGVRLQYIGTNGLHQLNITYLGRAMQQDPQSRHTEVLNCNSPFAGCAVKISLTMCRGATATSKKIKSQT